LARLTLTRPKHQAEPSAPFDTILASSLTVTDELKATLEALAARWVAWAAGST
jgi:hypothetical protein